jgi:predicted site-specific integrase-resolvase
MSKQKNIEKTDKYVRTKKAVEILGVHMQTLYNWEKKGKIETIRTAGGQRLYNVEKYIKDQKGYEEVKEDVVEGVDKKNNERKKICYVRVSTLNQKEDLIRQKNYMQEKYPKYEIIEDIGSGINFNRRGFRKIIEYAIEGKIEIIVVAYKDRLTRFGFELIEDLIKKYSKGTIIETNKTEKEPKEELVEDVLQILNVYTAKLNGMRKYKKLK